MNLKRIEVVLAMRNTGVVPVFYHEDLEVSKQILKACYEAGARVFEFTNRGNFAHEVFKDLNRFSLRELPDMFLGIGSVIDPGTASLYLQLGASFIVSPIFNPEIAKVCNKRKVLWIPGCGSLTEISNAEELGAEIVKIFPAVQVGGPEFIKAIKAPFPWTNLMPTGGVDPTEEDLEKWFRAGAYCVGMGSSLFRKSNDGTYNFRDITEKLKTAIRIAEKLRVQ